MDICDKFKALKLTAAVVLGNFASTLLAGTDAYKRLILCIEQEFGGDERLMEALTAKVRGCRHPVRGGGATRLQPRRQLPPPTVAAACRKLAVND